MSLITTISELSSPIRKKLAYATLAILSMIVFGTVSFHFIEDLSWSESIYLATATVTTVGYGDIVPRTPNGQAFTTFFMLVGVGTVFYSLSVISTILYSIRNRSGKRSSPSNKKEMENVENRRQLEY